MKYSRTGCTDTEERTMASKGMTEITVTADQVRVGDVVLYGVKWGKVQSVTATPNGPKIEVGLSGARVFKPTHTFRALVGR